MSDFDKALLDIAVIRAKLASGTEFQGFGPLTVALTAGLALFTGFAQTFIPALSATPKAYFTTWIVAAVISVALIALEMVKRSRRHHGGLADSMLHAAAANFIPAGVAGLLLFIAFAFYAPDLLWLLPPLWLILVGIGIFSALRMLPTNVMFGAAFYIILGFITFIILASNRILTPWAMALPFALGQGVMAILLHVASRKNHVE